MKCVGANIDGTRCQMQAMTGSDYCFSHDRLPHSPEVFLLSLDEVSERIGRLTRKQREALEFLCSGQPIDQHGQVLGISAGSFQNRLVIARDRAGVRDRAQLICLYAIWRFWQYGKAGKHMTDKFS